MPAKGKTTPTSMRQRVLAYLKANPGLHSCRSIADGLGLPADDVRRTHKVAIAARGLWEVGDAVRGVGTYGAAPEKVAAG